MKAMIAAVVITLLATHATAGMLADAIGKDCIDPEWYADASFYDEEEGVVEYLGEVMPVPTDKFGVEHNEYVFREKNGSLIKVQYNGQEECYLVTRPAKGEKLRVSK